MMSSKVSAQFAFDDLGCYQERHLAEAREICLCRRIDHLDIVGVFQKIERDGLDRTFAGDRGNFILKFANVVHVDRRHYRNSGVEEFLDFLPPLGMAAPGRIRIRESVNDHHLRMPP